MAVIIHDTDLEIGWGLGKSSSQYVRMEAGALWPIIWVERGVRRPLQEGDDGSVGSLLYLALLTPGTRRDSRLPLLWQGPSAGAFPNLCH